MAKYDVDGRSAIVTGGGSGIGRAVALTLAASGAAVLVADRVLDGAVAVVDEIRAAGGVAEPFACDVTDPDAGPAVVAAAADLGPVRIAVNNAGVRGTSATVGDYPLEDWRQVMDVNLDAVLYGMQAQLPVIAENGGGAIINLASVLGILGFQRTAAYVSAKHAVVGLTQTAALEYGPLGVRVNAVAPGFVRTPLLANLTESGEKFLSGKHALGRMAEAEEVAHMVAFLASDAASFVTGSVQHVDGGYAAQ